MMEKGILLVAIGKDYERLCACACRYGRKFTDLPIVVVTDVTPENECQAWDNVPNVRFIRGDYLQKDNRVPKLRMPTYTPFEKTLYIDVDAVIQNPGVEKVFDLLDDADFAVNRLMTFENRIPRIYCRAMRQFKVKPPLPVYNGGLIAFRMNAETLDLFARWEDYWDRFGRGREMPPLNCAIQNTKDLRLVETPKGYFEPCGPNTNAVIQHNYAKDFCERFELPDWQPYKPFDNDPKDFSWEDWK